MSRKAIFQVESFVRQLLDDKLGPEQAKQVAHLLATGVWTHDHPLLARDLQLLGLPTRIGVPEEERDLLSLYPQPRGRETAVEYTPGVRRRSPGNDRART
jgi:hypothetical protein